MVKFDSQKLIAALPKQKALYCAEVVLIGELLDGSSIRGRCWVMVVR